MTGQVTRVDRAAAVLRAVADDLASEAAALSARPEPYAQQEAAAADGAARAAYAAAATGDLYTIRSTLIDPYAAGNHHCSARPAC